LGIAFLYGLSSVDYKVAQFLATNGTLGSMGYRPTDLRPLSGNRLVEIVESLLRYTEVLVRELRMKVAIPNQMHKSMAKNGTALLGNLSSPTNRGCILNGDST